MSDAPMSRRERRTYEEEAADRAASQDPTVALPYGLASGEHDEAETDTAAISRRDRRRMERLAHPLEAWTAEEEMLATGQIPIMTPERIAEQERISREKADRAAREALEASQEFRRLAESDIRRAPAAEAPARQASAAQPVWPQEPAVAAPIGFETDSEQPWPEKAIPPVHTPPESALPELALPEPVLPDWPMPERPTPALARPDSPAGVFADEEPPHATEEAAHVGNLILEPYQPVMALDDEPLAPVVHPVHQETAVAAEPESAEPPVAERPNIFEALFPPGSSQSMLRQQDPFATASTEEPVEVVSGQVPTLLPPQEVPARAVNPADEMRRLAAEAISGIERAAKADEAAAAAAAAAAVGPVPDPSARAEFDSLPSAGTPSVAQTPLEPRAPQGPSAGGALSEFSWASVEGDGPSAKPAASVPTFDSIGNDSRNVQHAPASGQFPMPGQQGAPASGQFPMPGQQGAPASGQFPMPTQQGAPAWGQFPMPTQQGAPASGQFPMPGQLSGPQGPAWTSQPANATPGGAADPNDFTPLSNVPKPDFSGLYQQGSSTAIPPVTGGINTQGFNTAGFTTNDPTATGQLAAIRRPDLPEVGGAKHFKWLHLAVIGALMFVLGVVIYNTAFAR